MSMASLEFNLKEYPKFRKSKEYQDVQKSVNLLFGILEEYARLEKKSFQNLEQITQSPLFNNMNWKIFG